MKGFKNLTFFIRFTLLVSVISAFMAGCMPGTIETAVGTGFVYEQKQNYAHQHDVEKAVDAYIKDHADSPCENGEDRVIDSAVEIIKKYRLTGFDEVLGRLETIYKDQSQPDAVRAAALYNMAILHSRRDEGADRVIAREYFKRLYVEFPNHYRCIFEDSAWRDRMIEKQLLLPGETVESFLEEARKEVEARQSKER